MSQEVINLTEEEIQSLKALQDNQFQLIEKFGQLEYQIQIFELQKEKLVEQLEKSKAEENKVADDLNQKYGNGVINIQEGTFTKQ
tara:strand:- start:137 stop:391 length:255 start_codon:yes stop_codon:yes gene_type:complete